MRKPNLIGSALLMLDLVATCSSVRGAPTSAGGQLLSRSSRLRTKHRLATGSPAVVAIDHELCVPATEVDCGLPQGIGEPDNCGFGIRRSPGRIPRKLREAGVDVVGRWGRDVSVEVRRGVVVAEDETKRHDFFGHAVALKHGNARGWGD